MKKLQNNFTTPEQSKRLLELGVPADSADCYRERYIYDDFVGEPAFSHPVFLAQPYNDECIRTKHHEYIPCWSVGRLIEIYDMCFIYPKSRSSWCAYIRVKGVLFVDYIIDCYKNAIADKLLDFSKLED